MITKWVLGNNVRHTIHTAFNAAATSVTLDVATLPFRSIAAPVSKSQDSRGVVTFMDSLSNPTKIEIVTFTGWVDNGDGTITLSGLLRGQESTVASSFGVGNFAVQTLSADALNTPLMDLHHAEGQVYINGGGEPDVPALIVRSGGMRAESADEFNGQIIEIASPTHTTQQAFFRISASGDSVVFQFPNRADGLVNGLVYGTAFMEVSWDRYPPLFDKMVVLMDNVSIRRIEQLRAIRHDIDGSGSLSSNVTIDWSQHDIRRMSLSGNAVVTHTDTSDFYPSEGRYRRLTLIIEIPNVTNPGFTITQSANVKIPAGVSAPTFNTGQNQLRVLEYLYDGTYFLYEGMRTYQL